MRRQRNMDQMKAQNRTPEKELNTMEISNLSGVQIQRSFRGLPVGRGKEESGGRMCRD